MMGRTEVEGDDGSGGGVQSQEVPPYVGHLWGCPRRVRLKGPMGSSRDGAENKRTPGDRLRFHSVEVVAVREGCHGSCGWTKSRLGRSDPDENRLPATGRPFPTEHGCTGRLNEKSSLKVHYSCVPLE